MCVVSSTNFMRLNETIRAWARKPTYSCTHIHERSDQVNRIEWNEQTTIERCIHVCTSRQIYATLELYFITAEQSRGWNGLIVCYFSSLKELYLLINSLCVACMIYRLCECFMCWSWCSMLCVLCIISSSSANSLMWKLSF